MSTGDRLLYKKALIWSLNSPNLDAVIEIIALM